MSVDGKLLFVYFFRSETDFHLDQRRRKTVKIILQKEYSSLKRRTHKDPFLEREANYYDFQIASKSKARRAAGLKNDFRFLFIFSVAAVATHLA